MVTASSPSARRPLRSTAAACAAALSARSARSPVARPIAALPSSRPSRARARIVAAISRARASGPPPVPHCRPAGPARGLHPPRRPHQLADRLGQQPLIGRVGHVRADQRRIGPHPRRAQQPGPSRLSLQRLVQPGHRRLPAPGGQLHQRRRMRHLGIQADHLQNRRHEMESLTSARTGSHNPAGTGTSGTSAAGSTRSGWTAAPAPDGNTARTARRTPGHPAAHPPAPAPPAAAAAQQAAATPTSARDRL